MAWAKQLGHAQAAALFKSMLDEEYGADRACLSKLAEERLNAAAA